MSKSRYPGVVDVGEALFFETALDHREHFSEFGRLLQ